MQNLYFEVRFVFVTVILISATHYLLIEPVSATQTPADKFVEFFGILETKFKAVYTLKLLSAETRQIACSILNYNETGGNQESPILFQLSDDILLQTVSFAKARIRKKPYKHFSITDVPVFECKSVSPPGAIHFYAAYLEKDIYYKLQSVGPTLEIVSNMNIQIADYLHSAQIEQLISTHFYLQSYRVTAANNLAALTRTGSYFSPCQEFNWDTDDSIQQKLDYKNIKILDRMYRNIPVVSCPKKNGPGEFMYVLHYTDNIYFAIVQGLELDTNNEVFHYSIKKF